MATGKEKWSRYTYDPAAGTGTRVWTVPDATTVADALAATNVVQANGAFAAGSPAKTRGPVIDRVISPGGGYEVRCDFSVPSAGEHWTQNADPLAQPCEVEVEVIEFTEAVDKDLSDRPILDGAGNPLSGSSRVIKCLAFTFFKNHASFNLDWFDLYANSVNDAAVTLFGITFPAQHFYCDFIKPIGRYPLTASYLQVAGRFIAVPEDMLGAYPFQSRLMNAGLAGWYDAAGTETAGKFVVQGSGGVWEAVSSPVKLALNGTPLDTTIKVGDGKAAVAKPTAIATYQTEVQADATWLIWEKTKTVSMTGLSSIFF